MQFTIARKGHQVGIYEFMDDTRKTDNTVTGRNINLVLSARGQKALAGVRLEQSVLDGAVPMNGQIYHYRDELIEIFDYRKENIFFSLKRMHINEVLLNGMVSRSMNKKILLTNNSISKLLKKRKH